MQKLFSTEPIWQKNGLTIIRIIVGCFLIYHGKEVFDTAKMQEYIKWDMFKSSSVMPYVGKGAEFVGGILLALGLFTRLAAIIIICTFVYITFFVGNGKFWMDDQHPFLFALIGLIFFFTGPGALSLDERFFKKRN